MLNKRKFYINGQWVDPIKKNDFEVINPCNEDPFAVISLGSKEDTDLAVKSAKNAFETWKETSKEERLSLLEKLLSVYKKRFREMAEAISLEMGAPMDWATNVQTIYLHAEDSIPFLNHLGKNKPQISLLIVEKKPCQEHTFFLSE